VKSFGWFENQDCIFIAMEYCRHGDLQHYLSRESSLPQSLVQQIVHQMIEGLDQMHQNGFAHRDMSGGHACWAWLLVK
jgi:serine/threonine protein kinase